jgi:diguanylate cyclase (GGDEF)-like protein
MKTILTAAFCRRAVGSLAQHFGTFAPAAIAMIVVVIGLIIADHARKEQLLDGERAHAAEQLAAISSRLQTNLNGNVRLLQGFVATIAAEPQMDRARFSTLSEQLFRVDSQLHSLAGAPNLVVNWVYPEKGNEKAIGLDYRTNALQRDGALAARNSHNVVLVGPIDLVQGGTGLIARCPVYVSAGTAQKFWGIVSGVIDLSRLYQDSGLPANDVDIAISHVPEPQSAGDVFLGDPATFAQHPVHTSLDLGYGRWYLAAIPYGGWGLNDRMVFFRICEALMSLCLVGPLVWAGFLARSRQKTIGELQSREAELIFARQTLEHRSVHDPLTGLLNRRFIDSFISQNADRSSLDRIAFIHVDLDRFKEINDTRGHAAGDSVLQTSAARLQAITGPNDLVARIGGDEFVLVTSGPDLEETATDLATRIVGTLSRPILIDGGECRIGASVGVAWQEGQTDDLRQLLVNADIALYEAKKCGRGRAQLFTEELRVTVLQSKQLADDLITAFERNEFVPYFQPQFDARTRKLTGIEALARWKHPEKGIIAPDKFMHVAESLGRVGEIDRSILTQTVFQSKRWEALGIHVPRMSVNVSASRLADPDLLSELSRLPFREGSLCFELLETISFDGHDASFEEVISKIKALGIQIEMDDFGSGYASIVSLLRLSPSRLKIDRRLVAPVVWSQAQRRLVSSIVEIGRSLDIEIVAEGVETMEHAEILQALGCHVLQGFAFARPMSAEQFIAFCEKNETGPPVTSQTSLITL